MSKALPEPLKRWLDGLSFPVVATIEPDGRPQLSVVWAERDGDALLFSTVSDRRKARNLTRDARVSALVTNPEDPYEYVEIRGVAELIDDPGGSLIKRLGRKYDGEEFSEAPDRAAQRVVVRITADHLTTYGI
jgi:PPOX class probable F420-dependent enzyme